MPKLLARWAFYFNRLDQTRAIILLLVLHVCLWTLDQALATANLDRYGDMLENYAWGQVLEWGSFKHPPLFAWVAGLWFRLTPLSDFSYHCMAYLNVALGLAGVAELVRGPGGVGMPFRPCPPPTAWAPPLPTERAYPPHPAASLARHLQLHGAQRCSQT